MTYWWDDQLAGAARSRLPVPMHAGQSPVPASNPTARDCGAARVARAGDEYRWWWTYARRCAASFRVGIVPPEVQVFGPVLDDNEAALLTAELAYCRLYGGDGRYDRSDFLVFGRPTVMAGALAVNAAINHRRKVIARREAAPRWRDNCRAGVIVTTHRLLCDTGRGWDSYWYGAIAEFYPDLASWSITIGFDECAPLRLVGPAAPAVCLWIATAVLRERWESDPRLAPLLN
jgi:hypothetical protein